MNSHLSYLLITSARNEGEYIEKTILSVISQTILPCRWIIVDDGSTDDTAKIVKKYASDHKFITLLSTVGDQQRNFGSKAKAVNFAYKQSLDSEFNYVGNLDADISFDPLFIEKILLKMEDNKLLGLAGGVRYDFHGRIFKKTRCSKTSVGGPCQIFRKECFEDIGGYLPLKHGGVDTAAEVMARMKGWGVESFDDVYMFHHRRTGTAKGGVLKAKFRQGVIDFAHGNHPLFELVKLIYRCRERPYIIGSASRLVGFTWGHIRIKERELPDNVILYLRKEQIGRVSGVLTRMLS